MQTGKIGCQLSPVGGRAGGFPLANIPWIRLWGRDCIDDPASRTAQLMPSHFGLWVKMIWRLARSPRTGKGYMNAANGAEIITDSMWARLLGIKRAQLVSFFGAVIDTHGLFYRDDNGAVCSKDIEKSIPSRRSVKDGPPTGYGENEGTGEGAPHAGACADGHADACRRSPDPEPGPAPDPFWEGQPDGAESPPPYAGGAGWPAEVNDAYRKAWMGGYPTVQRGIDIWIKRGTDPTWVATAIEITAANRDTVRSVPRFLDSLIERAVAEGRAPISFTAGDDYKLTADQIADIEATEDRLEAEQKGQSDDAT